MRYAKLIAPLAVVAFVTHVAHAGPILDWWRQKHAPAQPVVVQTAPVAAGVCVDTSACGTCETGCDPCSTGLATGAVQPTVVNYAGYGATTAYSPVYANAAYGTTAAYAPAQAYSQAYAPQWRYRGFFPRYRSVWAAVPVTTYRPVATVDPTTGAQVTTLQPCMTYAWQVRRVPVSSLWPSRSAAAYGYTPVAATGYAATGYAATGYAASGYAAQTVAAPGCSSCAADGGYSSTIQLGPASSAPSLSPTPAVTVPAGPAGTVPAETAPADQPPSLNPGDLNPGAALRTTPQPSVRVSRPTSEPSGPELDPAIKPVPDPDAPANAPADAPAAGESDTPSPIFRHRQDRTAAFPVRQAWAFTPVSWPKDGPPPTAAPAAAATERDPVDAPSDEIKWDASGWKSVGR